MATAPSRSKSGPAKKKQTSIKPPQPAPVSSPEEKPIEKKEKSLKGRPQYKCNKCGAKFFSNENPVNITCPRCGEKDVAVA